MTLGGKKKKVLFLVAYFYESNHTPKVLFSLETSFCEELMLKPSLQSHLKKHNKARAGLQSIRNKHKIKCSYWLNTRTMFFFFSFSFLKVFSKTFSQGYSQAIEKQCCGIHVCVYVCVLGGLKIWNNCASLWFRVN